MKWNIREIYDLRNRELHGYIDHAPLWKQNLGDGGDFEIYVYWIRQEMYREF